MGRMNLIRYEDLQPEQRTVINRCTTPDPSDEIILVQGVAGSGKTTIALHIVKMLSGLIKNRPSEQQPTILFLTYNRKLAETCYKTLEGDPEVIQYLSQGGLLRERSINVMTVQDLFKLGLSYNPHLEFRNDEECIGEIGQIAASMGVINLLPSQIFALITTFLRGRPELIGISIDELEDRIEEETKRSNHYQMYGDALQKIRRYILGKYEAWKGEKLDRADIASEVGGIFDETEELIRTLNTVKVKQIRESTRRRLGDSDPELNKLILRLTEVFQQFCTIPKLELTSQSFYKLLNGTSLNESEFEGLKKNFFSLVSSYGLMIPPLWETVLSHLQNPVVIVDEIQDLSVTVVQSEAES